VHKEGQNQGGQEGQGPAAFSNVAYVATRSSQYSGWGAIDGALNDIREAIELCPEEVG
jgi:hypothetical protein